MDLQTLRYNARDAAITLAVNDAFDHEIDRGGYRHTYDFTTRLYEPLIYMMTRGIRVDHEALSETRKEIEQLIEQKQEELDEIVGHHLNFNSSKQLQQYFYVEKGIEPFTKTVKQGGQYKQTITVDDKALQRLAKGTQSRKPLKEARIIQELRGYNKLKSTYLDIQFDEDGRMRCFFKPRGTKFGRLSSAKTILGTGMNLQNLPMAFKKFLVADPGYVLVEVDKEQAEWVVVAYMSGDAQMLRVLEEGIDPHVHTAHLMFGVPHEVVKEENKLIGHETDPGEIERLRKNSHLWDELKHVPFLIRNMSMRQAGKKANHGLNYDEGPRTFALTNEIMEGEAKKIIELYHQAYPGIRHWHEQTQSLLRHNRQLTNCFGRVYKFLGPWGDDLFKQAYAFGPQSTVADLVNWGIIHTYEDQSEAARPIELLAQVHDSILFQVPMDCDVDAALSRVYTHMNPTMEYNGREFQIASEAKAGLDWSNMEEVGDGGLEETIAQLQG